MIVTYNKEQVGDVLMLTLKNSGEAKLAVERKGKVARVYREGIPKKRLPGISLKSQLSLP